MSYARIRCYGRTKWYDNVTAISCSDGYLHLTLAAHPSLVHFWLSDDTDILLCATGEEVTQSLREEKGIAWST